MLLQTLSGYIVDCPLTVVCCLLSNFVDACCVIISPVERLDRSAGKLEVALACLDGGVRQCFVEANLFAFGLSKNVLSAIGNAVAAFSKLPSGATGVEVAAGMT